MEDYKERMKSEYQELKERYNKLRIMLTRYDAKTLDFTPSCPIELLKKQASIMYDYMYILEVRAQIEKIDL